MTLCRDDLYQLWLLAHDQPRWLACLSEMLGLDQQAETYLGDLDEAWRAQGKGMEIRWREEVVRAVAESRRLEVIEHPELARCRGLGRVDGSLKDEEIRWARSRPLESVLLETPVKGFISCPLHQERIGKQDRHPSMLVRAGFGYCFSCGARLDAIGYLMKVRGLDFRDAIRALQ